jgi:outer membrane protein assembly factor BamB
MTIEAHPGLFTGQSIRKDAQRTPAILTSLLKAADGDRNTITFVSWVLYRASSADTLYDGALKIVSALIPVIRKADFDLVIKDTNIEAECLYSGTLDALNITLWAVKWEPALGDYAITDTGPVDELEYFDGTATAGTGHLDDHTNMED